MHQEWYAEYSRDRPNSQAKSKSWYSLSEKEVGESELANERIKSPYPIRSFAYSLIRSWCHQDSKSLPDYLYKPIVIWNTMIAVP